MKLQENSWESQYEEDDIKEQEIETYLKWHVCQSLFVARRFSGYRRQKWDHIGNLVKQLQVESKLPALLFLLA